MKIWHENGVLRTENTFYKGERVGKLKQWGEDGIEILPGDIIR